MYLIPGYRAIFYIKTGITSLFGFSNLYLVRNSTDYFSTAAELNPFTHLWSLGVEEQYYFIYPFYYGLQVARKRKRGVKTLIISFLSSLSLISFLYGLKMIPRRIFFNSKSFLGDRFGCIAFLITYKRRYQENSIYLFLIYSFYFIMAVFLYHILLVS